MMKSLRIEKLKSLSLAALLMAGAAFTACSSSDDIVEDNPQPVENPTAPKVYTMTIQATKPTGDDATTRGLYWGDDTKKELKVNWNGKEKVRVVQDGTVIGTLSATISTNESTTLTGTLTGFDINSGIAFYLLADENGTMDYTGQKGNIMDDNGTGNIEDNYDFASYELEGQYTKEAFTIDGNTIVPKDGTYIPFASQQAIVRFELLNSSGDNLYTTQLIVTDNQSGKLVQSYNPLTNTKTHGNITITPSSTSTSNVYYAALNFDAASDIQLRAFDSNGDLYTYDKKNVTFTKGKYYRVKVKMLPKVAVNLATLTADYEAQDGDILFGTLANNFKISVPNGATVTLDGVTIERENTSNDWAGITCEGNATIILKDGSNNTVIGNTDYPGIQAAKNNTGAGNEYTLTIKGSGSLNVSGHIYPNNHPSGAGIGGGNGIDCGNIVIEGGTITANGGNGCAGIGGGYNASCGSITISGGTIDAEGGNSGAGIGCGKADNKSASCNNISISGGTITAKGGDGAAGIGSSELNNNKSICGDISISGGTVTATGGDQAAGIGSGNNGECGNISISHGTVTATGGDDAAGIGGGIYAKCGVITIKNTVTKVTATKGDKSDDSLTDPYSIGIGSDDADRQTIHSTCVCGSTIFDNDSYKFTPQWNHDGDNPNSWTYSPEPASGTYGGLTLAISGNTWTLTPVTP